MWPPSSWPQSWQSSRSNVTRPWGTSLWVSLASSQNRFISPSEKLAAARQILLVATLPSWQANIYFLFLHVMYPSCLNFSNRTSFISLNKSRWSSILDFPGCLSSCCLIYGDNKNFSMHQISKKVSLYFLVVRGIIVLFSGWRLLWNNLNKNFIFIFISVFVFICVDLDGWLLFYL